MSTNLEIRAKKNVVTGTQLKAAAPKVADVYLTPNP